MVFDIHPLSEQVKSSSIHCRIVFSGYLDFNCLQVKALSSDVGLLSPWHLKPAWTVSGQRSLF